MAQCNPDLILKISNNKNKCFLVIIINLLSYYVKCFLVIRADFADFLESDVFGDGERIV